MNQIVVEALSNAAHPFLPLARIPFVWPVDRPTKDAQPAHFRLSGDKEQENDGRTGGYSTGVRVTAQ